MMPGPTTTVVMTCGELPVSAEIMAGVLNKNPLDPVSAHLVQKLSVMLCR